MRAEGQPVGHTMAGLEAGHPEAAVALGQDLGKSRSGSLEAEVSAVTENLAPQSSF